MNFKEQFKKIIDENSIVLFMKGTKDAPVCGFSNTVVQLLNHYGVNYKDVNILEDPQMDSWFSSMQQGFDSPTGCKPFPDF